MKKLKNPTNPTQSQIVYRNSLWAKALRDNKKKARGQMSNNCGGRCCLKVAEDVAIAQGLDCPISERGDEYPDYKVKQFFGWNGTDPSLSLPDGEGIVASELNDDQVYRGKRLGVPHSIIAECVENTFVHPSRPKWTFELL